MSSAGAEPRTLAPPARREAIVRSNRALGAYRLVSASDPDGPPDPQPGQFYMLSAVEGWGGGADERPYLPRAFSYARARPDGAGGVALEFLLEAVGPGTERLAGLEEGQPLWLVGPLGRGFSPPARAAASNGRPGAAVLVGGGIGVAPLLCLGDMLGREHPVLLGFRSAAHAEVASLFGESPAIATEDGSRGRRGLVTELLLEEIERRAPREVYACGPPAMLEAVRAVCAHRELPAQLAMEAGMACGFGACFGCVVPTRTGHLRLCVDGPVVRADRLDTVLFAGAGHA